MAGTGATPFILSAKQQMGLITYFRQCYELHSRLPFKEHFEYIDREYARENMAGEAWLKTQLALKQGNKGFIPDQVIPVLMPQIEGIATYLEEVFLSGYPIFGVTAPPGLEGAAQQMEALIADNSLRGNWVREFKLNFRKGLRYNLAFMETTWEQEWYYSAAAGKMLPSGRSEPKKILWEGNVLKDWDPYNTFWDIRVNPAEHYKLGEFIGNVDIKSRVALKALFQSLPAEFTTNAKPAFESTVAHAFGYKHPLVNTSSLLCSTEAFGQAGPGETNWEAFVGLAGGDKTISYKDHYEVAKIYARIIPADFDIKVSQKKTPQVWKFYVVNGQHIIYAEQQTNAHNYLPVVISQPLEDGLHLQTKGVAENLIPFQDAASGLWNSSLSAKRRALFDRIFYDPSRVRKEDINSTNPIARVPVKGAAYGKSVSDAVYIAPFQDRESANLIGEAREIIGFAEQISGSNRVQQGMFQKGNKTKQEWDDTMGRSNARMASFGTTVEAQQMVPIKTMLETNILQYQPPGTVTMPGSNTAVKISPQELREAALTFNLSDGLLPSDKLIAGDMFAAFTQFVGASPQAQAEFDLVGAFVYQAKLKGATWIEAFRRTPAQATAQLPGMSAAASAANPQPPTIVTPPTLGG